MADKKVVMIALKGARSNKSQPMDDFDLKRMIMLSHGELGATSSKVASGDIVKAKIVGRVIDKGEEGIKMQVDTFQIDDGSDNKQIREKENIVPSPS